MTGLVEELPLSRAKLPGLHATGCTGREVGPGSYDIKLDYGKFHHGIAPFGCASKRFEEKQGRMVPGVGTYDILPTNTRKANISVIPFRSKVFRFQVYGGDDAPGPGTYSPCENPVRRRTRSHMIGFFRQEGPINGDTPGPGSYISHEYKKKRLHPGGIRFEAYSGRGPLQSNEYPGPGQYEYRDTDNSIYSRKPTISFASKTERSHNGDNGNPGPGAYDLPSVFLSKEHHEAANPEPLLAFCTKAARYLSSEKESYPGPGAYTGEIAPRRPQLCNEKKSVRSFAVTLGHTKPPARSNLGPGTYDPEKPRKGPKYQLGSVAFCSAADRFPPLKFKEEKTDFIPRRDTERAPRRVHPARVLSDVIFNMIKPRKEQPFVNYLDDDRYDVIKPRCMGGGYLGCAPRFTSAAGKSWSPGPGQYNLPDNSSAVGKLSQCGTWGVDGRFKRHLVENPGPGHYSCDATLLKKSFNRTVNQSDAM